MNHLLRDLAPISEAAWAEIEDEAKRTLRHFLAARKLMEFSGPHGWAHSAQSLGRVEPVGAPREGVEAGRRSVLPLVELRVPFELQRRELDAVERGAPDPDLAPLVEAATRIAATEDRAVFHGFPEGGIVGIAEASTHEALTIGDDYNDYPGLVARAVATMKGAGVDGPYAIALGPRCYTGVVETTQHGGYPVLEHIKLILGGPLVWAPAVNGAVVLSQRGGDFELVCGQDLSIGYLSHTDTTVRLYLEETFTFRPRTPEAAVALVYQG